VVEVLMDIPKYIEPGKDLTVNMLVTRGSTRGFIKIEKYFPVGIVAVPIENAEAEFSFNHNYLVIFWKDFPDKDEVEVKYKLIVPASIEGKGKIEGKVSYFEKGKMTNYAFEDLDVTFQKRDADDETDKTVETPMKVIVGTPNKTKGSIEKVAKQVPTTLQAKRNITVLNATEMLVQVNVEQSNLSGFLKIEEEIPAGLKATVDGASSSSFSFVDNKVKFVWSDAPKENQISVSYKLSRDGFNATSLNLIGSVNYLDNGDTKKVEIKDENIAWDFKQAESTEKVNVKPEVPAKKDQAIAKKSEPKTEKAAPKKTSKPIDSPESKPITNGASKQSKGGIVFKVQICATQNKSDATKVAAEFNVTEEIESEMQDGWYKYTIGTFENYKDAKNMRDEKGNLSTVPFVAAYYNGKRISVQEALMIRSQKLMK
jgi:cell division septation protein DedD